jgi:heme/copper-type cytochrome/quinol oxidase subunit 3
MGHAQDHDFHIPGNNPWPPVSCLGAGLIAFGLIAYLHISTFAGAWVMLGGLLITVYGAAKWFQLLAKESNERGFKKVPLVLELGNKYGMIFFIISEIMFFAGFFAAFFYLRSYNTEWPPANIEMLDVGLPTINTLLLLTSGVTITWAHNALFKDDMKTCKRAIKATWILGVIFLFLQMYEYKHAMFSIDSGVFGSTFYMLTGFHGFHVLVGSLMLMVLSLRLKQGSFNSKHHFYFEAAAWYWHFVDVVWVGLYIFVYLL